MPERSYFKQFRRFESNVNASPDIAAHQGPHDLRWVRQLRTWCEKHLPFVSTQIQLVERYQERYQVPPKRDISTKISAGTSG